MAETEERIYIEKFTPTYVCPVEEYCTGFSRLCKNCNVFPTRIETIEIIAKALVSYEKKNNPNACEWSDLKERAKDVYRGRAEYVLNALLEDK